MVHSIKSLSGSGGGMMMSQHQDVRVLSAVDTIETLTRLEERLKEVKERTKKRVKGVDSLSLTLALADKSVPQDDALVKLCQAVARCFPRLLSLEICSEMDEETTPDKERFPIPIQALTALLHPHKGLKKLQELTLDGLRFHASDEPTRILTKAIARHACLQKCYLYDTSMTTLSSGRSGMEKFVSSVAKRLDKLVIIGCRLAAPEAEGLWAGSCLVKLCRSTTLQEVKLHNIDELKEEHIVLMSQALGTNTQLRKLSLLKSQDLPELNESLNISNHSKKQNNGPINPNEETLSSDAGTLALANMLKVNTVLEELCLSSFDFNEYSAMFLGNALEHDNTTLLDLWLMVPAHNGGTSSFPVDDPRIDYYLRLNRAGGRRRVVNMLQQQREEGNAAAEETPAEKRAWINTLINSKRDIDCSFYLLRNKPSLCDLLQQ